MVRKDIFILVLAGLLIIGTHASAASIGIPCNGPECQACHLVQLGQKLLTWFIALSASVTAFMFAWGGMQMVMSAGEAEGISKGKSMMWNSLIGFVILLSSWLIVDTFLKMFMSGASYGVWNEVQCIEQPAKTGTVATGQGTVTTPGTNTTPSAGKLTHEDAISRLSSNGIGVVSSGGKVLSDCSGVSGCTTLDGINAATIQDAIDLKKDCNCAITITGGTEGSGGHAIGTMSHSTGYKYDIRLNDQLDTYITTNYTNIGARSGDGAVQYRAPDGVIYAREGDHWDVKVAS